MRAVAGAVCLLMSRELRVWSSTAEKQSSTAVKGSTADASVWVFEDAIAHIGQGGYLAAEAALVLGVLADLHLLNYLTERGAVAGSVLAADSLLLCALSLRSPRHSVTACTKHSFAPLLL